MKIVSAQKKTLIIARASQLSVSDVVFGPNPLGVSANDILDGIYDYHSVEEILQHLESLMVSAKLLNETVWKMQGWGEVYGEIIRFYNGTKERLSKWYNWHAIGGQGDWDQIEERFARLEQWRQKAKNQGLKPIEDERAKAPPKTNPLADGLDSISSILWGVAVIGTLGGLGYLGYKYNENKKVKSSSITKEDEEEDSEQE